MNRKWMKLSLVLAVVALLAVSVTAAAAAWPGGGRGAGFGAGADGSLLATVADALGIEPADLVAELQAGKTVADLATDKGVELSAIVDALTAQHRELLANAVANGRLTQAQADARLEVFTANLTTRLSEPFGANCFGFMDADGDGVCDLCGQTMGGMRGRMGRGMMGRGMMGRGGMGQGMGPGGMWGNQGNS